MNRRNQQVLIGKAIEMYLNGEPVSDILRSLKFNYAYDITRQYLYKVLKQKGIEPNRYKPVTVENKSILEELEKKMIKF